MYTLDSTRNVRGFIYRNGRHTRPVDLDRGCGQGEGIEGETAHEQGESDTKAETKKTQYSVCYSG